MGPRLREDSVFCSCRSAMGVQNIAMAILFAGMLGNVRASAAISKIKYMTSGTHLGCDLATTVCTGGFEREFLPNTIDATYVIPQVASVKLTYDGTVAGGQKFMSIVEKAGTDPCRAANAGAVADATHSGPRPSDTNNLFSVQDAVLLDASRTYTVCYASVGNDASGTWHDTSITLKVSKIEKVTIYGRAFKTQGTIPHHASLTVSYSGSVLNGKWISMVDATLNSNNPCDLGTIAAASKDASHSGSLQAGNSDRIVTADTTVLAADKEFAVCYTESGGITASLWRDSGIRIKRSAIRKMWYGVDYARYGTGFSRDTYHRNTADLNNLPYDRFPQVANAKLMYDGELAPAMQISLVDATLGSNNPCYKPMIAAAAADDQHSGAQTADANKIATIPQGTLLDASKIFAVCYSSGGGIWADSYARYSISKLEALTHHSVEHVTTGQLPYTGAAIPSFTGSSTQSLT